MFFIYSIFIESELTIYINISFTKITHEITAITKH